MEEDQKSKLHKCKFCSKIFPCGRSLGGHMRSHLINISPTEKKLPPLPAAVSRRLDDGGGGLRENPKKARKFSGKSGDQRSSHDDDHSMMCKEDNTNSVSSHSNYSSSSSSDNEETPLLFCNNKMKKKKKKRSNTSKRYTKKNNATTDYSNCVSEQEEVALSLILLSMDYTSSALQSTNQTEEAEVNSPKTNFIKKKGPFKPDHSKKRKQQQQQQLDSELINDSCKFKCIICKKAFPSYQALGGHRASHKKFKGCCAPTTQTYHSPNIEAADFEEFKKIKEHECPICFKIFPSGQALGGHKRSHLIGDEAKSSDHALVSTIERRRIPQVRDFLDLNLPAPDLEEDCSNNEFNPYSCLQFLAY